jgi:hypothetical protein
MTTSILCAALVGLAAALVAVWLSLRTTTRLMVLLEESEAARADEAAGRAAAEVAAARARGAQTRHRLAAERAAEPRSWWATMRRQQLMVHLTDDTTIRGVVLEVTDDGVLLTAAEYLGDRNVPLGGEVFVARERVAFTQVPPRAGPATNGAAKR